MNNAELGSFQKIFKIINSHDDRIPEWKRLDTHDLDDRNQSDQKKIQALEEKKAFLLEFYKQRFERKYGSFVPNIASYSQLQVLDSLHFLEEETKKPFVFNSAWGPFRKPKRDDYVRALNHVETLLHYFRDEVQEQTKYLQDSSSDQEMVSEYCKYFEGLQRMLSSIREGSPQIPVSWNAEGEIYLGDILEPISDIVDEVPRSKGIVDQLAQRGLTDERKEWLRLPFTYRCKSPFVLCVDYSYDEGRFEVHDDRLVPSDLLRGLMYQIMRAMPIYSYSFEYYDPAGAGKELRNLQKLNAVLNGNAYWLQEELFENTFRLLRQADSQDVLTGMIDELSDYVGRLNRIRGGESVAVYNTKRLQANGSYEEDAGMIPQRFVFFENLHGVLSDKTASQINTLIENAAECGITLVLVSKHSKDDPLSGFEKKIFSKQGVDVLEWHSETEEDWYGFNVSGSSMNKQEDSTYHYNFDPYGDREDHIPFLEMIEEQYQPKLQSETRLEKLVDLEDDSIWGTKNADVQIEIPIGINERGKQSAIHIGGPEGAHALLAGSTGCGKSSLLHTVINEVILNYLPDDVQIWLSDYKANEFQRYIENTPPHIRYISTDRSMEYSMHFLDEIYKEYQKRIDLFGTITSVQEYRSVHGRDSMPRILIIVDEFHKMSNHVNEDPIYKTRLTEILREARSLGITFLFSDQTCGVGLKGLSEAGKLQLTCRMAMRTSVEEYNDVFNITNARGILPELKPFEVILRRTKVRTDEKGKTINSVYYEQNKAIFIDLPQRDLIAQKSIEKYGSPENVVVIDADKRKSMDWAEITEAKQDISVEREIPIYTGTPADLQNVLRIPLRPNYSENIMSVGDNIGLQKDVVLSAIESIRQRGGEYQILIIAEEYDDLFLRVKSSFNEIAQNDPRVQIITSDAAICEQVSEIKQLLEIRRKQQRPDSQIFVFWIGLDDISKTLEYLPDKKQEDDRYKNYANSSDSLDLMFGTESEDISSPPEDKQEDLQGRLYNANDDIKELFKEGPKRSVHHFVFLLSVQSIKRIQCLHRVYESEFKHKIAFRMGIDDASDYMGRGSLIKGMDGEIIDDQTAVYYDGMKSRRFAPFVWENGKEKESN